MVELLEVFLPICYIGVAFFIYFGYQRDSFIGFEKDILPPEQFQQTVVMLLVQLGVELAGFVVLNYTYTNTLASL